MTERLLERVLCLPTGETIDAEAVGAIASIIRVVTEHGAEAGRRLHAPAA